MMISLKPAAVSVPCKICGGDAPVCGAVDFNRNCEIPGGVTLPPLGLPVVHRRCTACGFLFTDAFDDWSEADFKTHIYNAGYIKVDPEYAQARPRANADAVLQLFGARRTDLHVLDFGGGNDVLCSALRDAGVPVAVTYDPFVPKFATRPESVFNLVTCFETLEHMPDPIGGIGAIAATVSDPGLVLFTTLVQPANVGALGLKWWYVGPRNGHVSMFSREALALAWRRHGFNTASLSDNLHIAFKTMPEFAKRGGK
jgi:2-polyprenyl-6-hydroxyphenyl methylase/3-demethylubiquinone-9 3-methyltransferase